MPAEAVDFDRLREEVAALTSPRTEDTARVVVPPFPVHVLPPAFRDYCDAAATSIGVPVEMIAMPLLAFLGSTFGNRLHIQLKRGYRQYGTLYLAVVADVGAAKSPALSAAQWPVDVLQKEAHATYKSAIADFERDTESWKSRDGAVRGEKPVRPQLRHYFSTNLTLEALVSILETAPGIAIIRDEVVSFIKSMDQYRGGKGSDRQEYLSLHAGTPIKADRRTGEAVYAAHPVACIVGGIQPDVFPSLHNANGQRDGMLERFIPIVPTIGLRQWTEDDIDPALLDPVVDTFRALNALPPIDNGQGGLCTQLHPDARPLWRDWYDDTARAQFETKGVLNGYYSKLPNHVARFALILNAAWSPDNANVLVSRQRMADAIDLGEWIRQNIHAVMPLLGESGAVKRTGIHSRILRVLRTAPEPDADGWVQRGVILQRLGNVKTDDLDVSLRYLESEGQIEHRRDPSSTTKPAEQWRISRAHTGEDSKYSRNLPLDPHKTVDSSNTSHSSTLVPFSRSPADADWEVF